MWMTIHATDRYNSGYVFYDIEKVKGVGGKFTTTGTRYTGLPIIFIPDDSRIVMQNTNGNIINGLANGLIPWWWFHSGNIKPQIDDYIENPDGITYRIVGIDDFTRHSPAGVYYLFLRRDELAFGRN